MAVDFLLQPPSFEIPTLGNLRDAWTNIPNENVRELIAVEHQYLIFHSYLLTAIKYTEKGKTLNPPYSYNLGFSVRAGAVKAAILVSASIAEAALRAHAECRGYPLPLDPKKRTFGIVLKAWEDGEQPRQDVTPIWDELQELHNTRNNIHLYKAAHDENAEFAKVLEAEEKTLQNARNVINHLMTLRSAHGVGRTV